MLEVLVEEPSARQALDHLVPKIVPNVRYVIREFAGKDRLLKELPVRLRGYAIRLKHERLKVAVLVDRDDDDCVALKEQLERMTMEAGLGERGIRQGGRVVLNRDPDAIVGGTSEALARVLARRGYQTSGLNKLRAASDVAPHMAVDVNRSRSFQVFRDGLRRLLNEEAHATP